MDDNLIDVLKQSNDIGSTIHFLLENEISSPIQHSTKNVSASIKYLVKYGRQVFNNPTQLTKVLALLCYYLPFSGQIKNYTLIYSFIKQLPPQSSNINCFINILYDQMLVSTAPVQPIVCTLFAYDVLKQENITTTLLYTSLQLLRRCCTYPELNHFLQDLKRWYIILQIVLSHQHSNDVIILTTSLLLNVVSTPLDLNDSTTLFKFYTHSLLIGKARPYCITGLCILSRRTHEQKDRNELMETIQIILKEEIEQNKQRLQIIEGSLIILGNLLDQEGKDFLKFGDVNLFQLLNTITDDCKDIAQIQKLIFHLFRLGSFRNDINIDILNNVINQMKIHQSVEKIQEDGCVICYNFFKKNDQRGVDVVSVAVDLFPRNKIIFAINYALQEGVALHFVL